MRIIIDAMGGDHAPGEIVKGAVQAQQQYDVDIILVGQEDKVTACLRENGVSLPHPHIQVRHATEVIDMCEDPSTAVRRKKDSSMAVALRMIREGEGDAVISAGSTGALLTGATLIAKRIRGIRRAVLATVIPNEQGGTLLMDSGANAECSPEYLMQFAYMGSFYAKTLLERPRPRVGLLNMGTEDSKGGELQKQTHQLLRQAAEHGRLNFIGNVEAKDAYSGTVDVIVTDGFTGNIMLKTAEGTAGFIMKMLKQSLMSGGAKSKLGAALVKDSLRELKTMMDPDEIGGTPLLGIAKPVLKAHGGSDAHAICSAVRQAIRCVKADISGRIEESIDDMRLERPVEAETQA